MKRSLGLALVLGAALSVLGAALSVLGAALSAGAAAAQIVVQPAQFATGVVTNVDFRTRTLTIENDPYVYYVRNSTTYPLQDVRTGYEVEITFVIEGGRKVALDMRRTSDTRMHKLFERRF